MRRNSPSHELEAPPPSKRARLLEEHASIYPEELMDPEDSSEPEEDLDSYFATFREGMVDWGEPLPATEVISQAPLPSIYREPELDPTNREYVTEEGFLLPTIFRPGMCNVIRAQMGTGKTVAAKNFIQKLREDPNYGEVRVLIVVPRKSLATSLAKDFDCVDYQKVRPIHYKGDTSYVICVNSLPRIAKWISVFNVVIFDELSGTLGNVHSSLVEFSLRTTICSNMHYLVDPDKFSRPAVPNGLKTVMVMDASMGERELSFLKSSVRPELWNFHSYYRPQSLKPLPKVVFEKCIFNFLRDLAFDVLCTEKRIVVATCAKEYMGVILKLLSITSDQFLSDLGIDTDGIIRRRPSFCYFDADTCKEKIQAHLDDQELFRKYDVFIYSPVFVSGISITIEHFDKLYAIAQYGTLNAEDFIQMLARIRVLRDNQITIGCSGKSVRLTQTEMSIDHIVECLKNLNQASTDYRDNILSALGVSREFYRVRGTYRNKEHYQSCVDDYFRSEVPDYQRRLMAHTVLLHLRTRYNMPDAVSQAMLLNHPEWHMRLSDRTYVSGKDLGKEGLMAVLLSHITELGNIHKVKTEEFLVIDTQSFDEKCDRYSLLGNSREDPDNKWEFRQDHIQSSFEFVIPRAIDSFLMYMSPFSLWYSFIVSYCSYGDNRGFGEEMASIQMYSELFTAMGWTEHQTIMATGTGPGSYLLLEPTRMGSIKVDTTRIVQRWKPLVRWSEKYRINLAMLGVPPINVTDTEAVITYRGVTAAKDCIVRLLGRCGLYFQDKSGFITVNATKRDGTAVQRKRIKRSALKTYSIAVQRFSPEEYVHNVPAGCDKSAAQVPCLSFVLDEEKCWRTIDVAMRRGFNLHFGYDCTDVLADNMKCLGVIWENSRQNLLNLIPEQVKDSFKYMFESVAPQAERLKSIPSFWLLQDEKQREYSFNALFTCYRDFMEILSEMCIQQSFIG